MTKFALGYDGDGIYHCFDGWENGECDAVRIEGSNPQMRRCSSTVCGKFDCSYHQVNFFPGSKKPSENYPHIEIIARD